MEIKHSPMLVNALKNQIASLVFFLLHLFNASILLLKP